MKKVLLIITIFSFVVIYPSSGHTGSRKDRYRAIDMSRLTCSEVLKISDSKIQKALVIWADGYKSAKSGNTVVNIHQLEDLAGQIEANCKLNPSGSFLQAVQNSKKTKSLTDFFSKKDKKKDRYSHIDMAKVTCSDAMNEKDRDVLNAVLIWIDGYLSEKSANNVVDAYELEDLAKRLERSCRAHPSMLLLDAVKKIKKGGHSRAGKKSYDRNGEIDMTKVTCSEALQIKDSDTQKAVVVWLDGYLSAKSGNTRVSVNRLKDIAGRLERYCRDNPSTLLIKAVKKQ